MYIPILDRTVIYLNNGNGNNSRTDQINSNPENCHLSKYLDLNIEVI